MAEDANANIRVDIDTAAALANIKNLQRQISNFHTSLAKSGAAATASSVQLQQGLLNSINRTGQFSATIKNVKSTTESFTSGLEKNKLSMREYFRYSGAATKSFGRLFKTEFDTINKVARERVKDLQTQYIKMGRDANGAMRSIAVRPLALDMESLATKTQIAAQKQALLNQMLKQGSTNLLNFGKNTQWAGRQLMVGFTIPLVMLGTVAGKTFMQMEKQAIRFKRVYGEMFTTTEDTNKALQEIKTLANEFTKYGVAVEKTMELAADAAAMGKMGAELTAQVAEATRLAVLGGVEQQEALKATISLTDAFAVSAEDLAKKTDFLNAVENQTVTSIEDLTIAIPKAGPVVQQLGGDVEDLTFFLTAMREGGINASEGANALKSGLASMINPTGKAAEMLQGFGINLKGIVDANKGDVKGIVIDFAKALDTLDPLNRAQAIEQLFGKFQFARLSTLFQNVIKEGNQASRVLKLANATTEELAILSERELKRIEDSPMFKFQKAIEDIKVTLVPLGEAFLKAVTPLLQFGTKILEKFNELDEGAKGFVVGLTAIAGIIGPVFLMGFGLVANGVANLIKMFVFFKTALNKAGSASTQLGMQTDYMTQQQLEASAVAASLNQVHQTLRQTFTSEAMAVNNLTAAYQNAILKQKAFSGAPAAARGAARPKGYARGVVSVPGPKGAGDVIPAMLSPGEAVIPAKHAKKYAPLISGMVSGNIPGFRFGLDPFRSMLGRSRVAVRMKQTDFSQALASSGKNARYKNAFQTGTGADYKNKSGSDNPKQKLARSAMERDIFGLDPAKTAASARPTYGYARTSALQSIFNTIFGLKGKQFNQVTAKPSKSLDLYGDLDLITKSSVARRSSAGVGDSLLDYVRSREALSNRRIDYGKPANSNISKYLSQAPMRGGSSKDFSRFENSFGTPFGSNRQPGTNAYSVNPKPPYVETLTPGGFGFNEIDRIVANNPQVAKQLRAELRSAGLGSVRVSGPGFVSRLFKKMGLPGYAFGEESVGSDGSTKTLNEIKRELGEKLRGSPSAKFSKAHENLTYKSFSQEEKVFLDSYKEDLLRENPNMTQSDFQKKVKTYLGYDLSHVRESSRLERLADGSRIKVKNWKTQDIIRESRAVNQVLENMSSKGHVDSSGRNLGRGTFIPNLNVKEIAKLAGVTEAVAASELQNLSNKVHPTTPNATRVLSAVAEKYGGSRGRALKRLLQFRLADQSPGSFFNAIKSGALTLGERPDLNREGLRSQNLRIKNAESKMVSSTTGERKPAKTKVVGGNQADTRMLAVSNGEAVASKKTVDAIRGGGKATIPGIGTISRVGKFGPIRVSGAYDGFPDGQTQDGTSRVYQTEGGQYRDRATKKRLAEKEAKRLMALDRKNEARKERSQKLQEYKRRRAEGISKNYGTSAKEFEALDKQAQNKLRLERKRIQAEEKQRRVSDTKARILDEQKIADARRKLAEKDQAKAARAEKNRGLKGKVAGGIGAIATMGVMGASMLPGGVGETAQQLMMPVMMLSMVLPMLTSTVGLVAAGLMGVVGGFVAVHLALENTRREASKTADSLNAGKNAMSKFAEMSGKVTPSEYASKRRELEFSPFTVQQGKTTFGQSFVDSESGKGMLKDFEAQTEQFGRSRAIEGLKKQLVTSVITGVLSPEQAKSIANSFGQKLQDYGITANINAAIQEITGPDGKLLDGNKIKIYVEYIQSSGSGLTGPEGILQTDELSNNDPIWWWDSEKVAKAEGEAAAMIKGFFDENQQIIDSLEMEYLPQIDALYAEGKIDEALAKEKEYQENRQRLMVEYNKKTKTLMTDFADVGINKQDAIMRQLIDTAKQTDVAYGTAADKLRNSSAILFKNVITGKDVGAREQRNLYGSLTPEQQVKEDAFQKVKVQFLGEIAAGNITAETFNGLMGMFDPTTGTGQATLSILADISSNLGTASLGQLENVFEVLDNKELAADIALNIDGVSETDAVKAQGMVDTLTRLSTFDGKGIEPKVVLKFFGENPEALEALSLKFTQLDDLKNKGMLDIETLVEQKIITSDQAEAFREDAEYFNSLPAEQKVAYTRVFLSKYETVADNEIAAWKKENPAQAAEMTEQEIASHLAAKAANQYTVANQPDPTGDKAPKTPGSSSGARKADPLDNILKALQNVRKASVNALGGTKELFKLFEKGKNISVFKGIENQLLNITSNPQFASFISGLDKKEQDLFITIKKGNVELTKRGRLLEKAYRAVNIGEFVLAQKQLVISSKNELTARNLLIKAGYSYVKAVELSRDATIAEAYADAASIKNKNKRTQAIKELNAALKEGLAAQDATLTAEEQFNKLYENIQAKLDADNMAIELKFKIDSAADDKIITEAENKIAALQYRLDDQEAGLTLIAEQEETINDKYDKRLDALKKVKEVNDKLAQQQRTQLSLADALSSGDMGAAALAMQQFQEDWSAATAQSQEDLVEKARQQELLGVTTSINNELKTRKQIEEEIKKIQKDIFVQEEDFLEPAAERNRLLAVQRDVSLEKLDLENNKWLAVKNSIDLAKTAATNYAAELTKANALALQAIADIKNPPAPVTPAPVTTPPVTPPPVTPPPVVKTPTTTTSDPTVFVPQTGNAKTAAQGKDMAETDRKNAIAVVNNPATTAKEKAKAQAAIEDAQERIRMANMAEATKVVKAPAPKLPSGVSLRSLMKSSGGIVPNYLSDGGMPKVLNKEWGKAVGTDKIPAMLTPGEFIMSRSAVNNFGVGSMKAMNDGTYSGNSMYNYNISVNVATNANPDEIARTVMYQIKQVNNQRVRGVNV